MKETIPLVKNSVKQPEMEVSEGLFCPLRSNITDRLIGFPPNIDLVYLPTELRGEVFITLVIELAKSVDKEYFGLVKQLGKNIVKFNTTNFESDKKRSKELVDLYTGALIQSSDAKVLEAVNNLQRLEEELFNL